jgi:hypothetical protein
MSKRASSVLGWVMLLIVVYLFGLWHGRTWGVNPDTYQAPASVQTSTTDACRYFQDLIAWRESDKVVKRRGIETFC